MEWAASRGSELPSWEVFWHPPIPQGENLNVGWQLLGTSYMTGIPHQTFVISSYQTSGRVWIIPIIDKG